MGRVRRSGTSCELVFRSAIHQAGYRYRLKSSTNLPGTPDIVLPKFKLAIFVDGCFWHGCPNHGTMPKTNTQFWKAKIQRNKKRDKQVDIALKKLGWRVLRVWEHEVKCDTARIVKRIDRFTKGVKVTTSPNF
jgi:DNA mismatch endonuclease (patch repair protein)